MISFFFCFKDYRVLDIFREKISVLYDIEDKGIKVNKSEFFTKKAKGD